MRRARPFVGALVTSVVMAALVAPACSGAGGSDSPTDPQGSGGASNAAGSGGNDQYLPGGNGGSDVDGSINPGDDGGLQGCAKDSYTGEIVPLDLYMMLDHSGSMGAIDGETGPTRWTEVTNAITEFLAMPGTSGISMGIGFFPMKPSVPPPSQCGGPDDCKPFDLPCLYNQCLGGAMEDDSCWPFDYKMPAVPISALPAAASNINSAMASQKPSGMTPMAPALWGAMEYASEWAKQHPDHATIVVLATDGTPTSCNPNEVEDVAAIAEGGFGSAPSIKTFVIGIGAELGALNSIAAKGGTSEALIIETGTNTGAEFLAALNEIRGTVSCTYKIPVPEEGEPDPNLLNVAFTPEGGTESYYPYVESAGQCQGSKAWYYDNPNDPHQIILCPAACDEVQNVKGRVDVVLGCKTIVK